MRVWRHTSKGGNSTFLNSCFVCLLWMGVLENYAQAADVDPAVRQRKGGVENSRKKELILAGKVYFHESYYPLVVSGGLFKADVDYNYIGVCEGSIRGEDVSGKERFFAYFACPTSSDHSKDFGKFFCCNKPPAQECCLEMFFEIEHDRQDKNMIKIVIIVCSVIGVLVLLAIIAVIVFCVCGISAAAMCCRKAGGVGGVVGGARGVGRSVPFFGGGGGGGQGRGGHQAYQGSNIPPPQQQGGYQAYPPGSQPSPAYPPGSQPSPAYPPGSQQAPPPYPTANR